MGWTSGLAVFGIGIGTWWEYTLVCIYQVLSFELLKKLNQNCELRSKTGFFGLR